MEIDTELSDEALEAVAGRRGLRISCLSRYYHQPEQAKQHVIVLNYSAIDREKWIWRLIFSVSVSREDRGLTDRPIRGKLDKD
ncbi:MAG: hypothetical protein ACLTSO_09320 [Coprococcus sp.]